MLQFNCLSARVSFVDSQYKVDFYRPFEQVSFFTHNGLVLDETPEDKRISENVNVMDEQGVLVGIFSVLAAYSTASGLVCGSVFSPHYEHLPDNSVYDSSAIIIDQTVVDVFGAPADIYISVYPFSQPDRQPAFLPELLVSYITDSIVVSNGSNPSEVFYTHTCTVQDITNLFNNDESINPMISIKGYPFSLNIDGQSVSVGGLDGNSNTYPNVVLYDTKSLSAIYGVGSSSFVDLTPVLTAISQLVTTVSNIDENVVNMGDMLQLQVVNPLALLQTAELNNLHEDIVSLGAQLQTVTVPLQSLNGNGCEYMDDIIVTVYGRDTVYSVARSYMSMTDNNAYTAVYDLVSTTGAKLTVPESLLSLYVAPVVTP